MLKNNREHKTHKNLKARIGTPLGIIDANGTPLCVGDIINYFGEQGVILYDDLHKKYEVFMTRTQWYGDDIYDPMSYGAAYTVHLNNGSRMQMEKIESDY